MHFKEKPAGCLLLIFFGLSFQQREKALHPVAKNLTQEKGWSRSKLAEELSVGRSLMTKWLSGTHNFTIDTLVDICQVLDISMIELLQKPQKKEATYQP